MRFLALSAVSLALAAAAAAAPLRVTLPSPSATRAVPSAAAAAFAPAAAAAPALSPSIGAQASAADALALQNPIEGYIGSRQEQSLLNSLREGIASAQMDRENGGATLGSKVFDGMYAPRIRYDEFGRPVRPGEIAPRVALSRSEQAEQPAPITSKPVKLVDYLPVAGVLAAMPAGIGARLYQGVAAAELSLAPTLAGVGLVLFGAVYGAFKPRTAAQKALYYGSLIAGVFLVGYRLPL